MSNEKISAVHNVGTKILDEIAWYYSLDKEDQKNLRKIRTLNDHPDGGPYTRWPDRTRDLESGYPVDGKFIPKKVRKNGPRSKKRIVLDFEQMFGLTLVTEKFRLLVESIEPDVHQFFPVDITWHGKPVEGKFYWFVICNALDTVSEEHTEAPQWRGYSPVFEKDLKGFWEPYKKGGGTYPFVYDCEKVGSAKIWIDEYISGRPKCTDLFKVEAEKADITGIAFGAAEKVV